MKVPTCGCFEATILEQTGHPVSQVMMEWKKDTTPQTCGVWVHYRVEKRICFEGIRMDMNFCPKCGARFEEADK